MEKTETEERKNKGLTQDFSAAEDRISLRICLNWPTYIHYFSVTLVFG